jgi:hypothetical protein
MSDFFNNNIRSKLKSYVYSIEFLHELSMYMKLIKQRILMRKIEKKAYKLGINLVGPSDLEKPNLEQYKTCHIIGSGWSLEETKKLALLDDAYVIGFNFACLAEIPFNLYFVEFGGGACKEIAYAQLLALDRFVADPNTRIIFKNLWQSRNDIEFAFNLYGNKVDYARDAPITCGDKKYLLNTTNRLLKMDSFFYQYSSSILTAIVVARNLGFKTCVLHGVDFGGEYFFDLSSFESVKSYSPPSTDEAAYSSKIRKANVHNTSSTNLGVSAILPIMRDRLKNEGMNLYSASTKSPLSKILKVFKSSEIKK